MDARRGEHAMAARTKSKVTPKYKKKYRVKGWRAYEASLRRRGGVTVWFDGDAVDAWYAGPIVWRGWRSALADLAG